VHQLVVRNFDKSRTHGTNVKIKHLLAVVCGCSNWLLSLREERKLRVF